MSIFGSILGAIFGRAQQTAPAPSSATAGSQQAHPQSGQGKAASPTQQAHAAPQQQPKPVSPPPQAAKPQQSVDVEAILEKLKAEKHANLDWRHSIVDLLKLLDLDSSLSARQELAKELHYSGDQHDSAAMNIWLHKRVMAKLAESGGKVPDSLKH
ncbi:MAG: DUF3597 domain-containing protein [Alphaproteobacteria bacterium]|nr:DUF3597 domain-containing protein [Alphaproteobacteria bacterium]